MSITISEKIEKEKGKLNRLIQQQKELERKIKKFQENISNYEAMLKQKTYKETDELLSANNLTLEMMNEAIKNGDLAQLQALIDKAKKSSPEGV